VSPPGAHTPRDLDWAIARLLTVGTFGSVVLLGVGVVAMALAGRSPLERGFPPLDLARLPADLSGGRPEGFLWLGLLAVMATPASRVLASLVSFVLNGERSMAVVAVAILSVIATSVVLALGLG
jgi:uncharacterized membrane protein